MLTKILATGMLAIGGWAVATPFAVALGFAKHDLWLLLMPLGAALGIGAAVLWVW